MRILIVISELKYSGAAKIASWLANNLAIHGNEVSLLTFIDGDDYHDISVERIRICMGISSRYFRTIRAIFDIRKIIKKNRYDIVISFLPLEGFISVLASLGTKAKVIVSERSDPYHEKSFVANVSRFFFRFADGAVFQSEGAQKYFSEKLIRKSTIIENPVMVPKVKRVPYQERDNIIVSSARLQIHQKRQDILLRAFAIVVKEIPSVKLKLIGDGPDENYLKKLSAELGINKQVIFAGKCKNVLEEISKAKVFAFSSEYEGMPNAVLEALSMGVPVVTTDYYPGGARQLIEEKKRGFVIKRNNSEQLADKLIAILNNFEVAQRMAENAISVCNEQSDNEIYRKWITYINCISNFELDYKME